MLGTLGSVVVVGIVVVVDVLVAVVVSVAGLMQSIRTMPQNDPNAGECCHKQHINCTQCFPKARGEAEEGGGRREGVQSLRSGATSYSISCRYRAMHVAQHFD